MRKKLSIALLAFSLAMLCANFLVRRVGRFIPPPEQEITETEIETAHGFVPIVIINGIRRYIAEDLSSTVAFDFSDCLYPCAIYGD